MSNKRVLIIDEEKFHMSPTREYCESIGLEVEQLLSVKKGIDRILENPKFYSGVLIDLMIPLGRGHTFSQDQITDPTGLMVLHKLLEINYNIDNIRVYSARRDKKVQRICADRGVIFLKKADEDDDKRLKKFLSGLQTR